MSAEEPLGKVCEQHGLEPYSLLSENYPTWLCKDTRGRLYVLKRVDRSQDPHTMLRALRALYTPFKYPVPVTGIGDPYLVYPWIEGRCFSDVDLFEKDLLGDVLELAGRIQALLRSLHLVPFFEKGLNVCEKQGFGNTASSIATRINFGCSPMLDQEIKKARRYEVAASYRWVNKGIEKWSDTIVKTGIWERESLEKFKELLDVFPAIHLPITGNNLVHGKFTPDHVILCPDGSVAVISWRVDPRPRRYMQLTFLAWALFRDSNPGIYDRFSDLFPKFFARSFYLENLIVLNICLLEQGYHFSKNGLSGDGLVDEKISSANRILSEGLATMVANRS